jgi:hypothetical protein
MSGYFKANRSADEITLYLSPKQPSPSTVPYELQNYITDDEWAVRVPAVTRAASRYSKPIFERIWLLIAFFTMVFLPTALFRVILGPNFHYRDDDISRTRFFLARGISVGSLIGVALFFIMPIAIWKFLGRRNMDFMLQKWAMADRMLKGQNVFLPTWTVKTPGIFRDSIILSIRLPADRIPTSFHPDAYLPSYINGPNDAVPPPTYLQDTKDAPGYPATYGSLPLYEDEKRGFHNVQV